MNGTRSAAGVREYPHQELTGRIIGAATEVHRQLGRGFLEKVYEEALALELRAGGIPFERQARLTVRYKETPIGLYVADIVVDGKILCELKALDALSDSESAQVINYLKATGLQIGLLLNFGRSTLQVRRLIF